MRAMHDFGLLMGSSSVCMDLKKKLFCFCFVFLSFYYYFFFRCDHAAQALVMVVVGRIRYSSLIVQTVTKPLAFLCWQSVSVSS